ncbi:hypothetical protein Vau01_064390 [Virgisporangium aurantiacum]|uniref:Glycosyl transferases group 1 n=1 Tax=Virgisporangium aurantiacum TaxID=175570 RepID=A0A8J3Z9Q5_9ACTN|nr:glycosyltransferase family 4 protein [Virgisporangium aurantiacum]GIJ58923.1 hypothetical protein Vau01_064390 [Virgisporangium aurantiacum]
MEEERRLLRPPAIGAGVGPQLYDRVRAELAAFADAPEPVRIDPGFDLVDMPPRQSPSGGPIRVLLLGRMEDRGVKGLDLAAKALAEATRIHELDPSTLELVLRGVPEAEFDEIRTAVLDWAGARLRVTTRSYTVGCDEWEYDLRRAVLLLMPSRAEGFGMAGLEAIVAGTPVLISDRSGLGELIREVAPSEARQIVVPIKDDARDLQTWGTAIAAVLTNPAEAFARAETLRRVMAERRSWSQAAQAILAATA